MKISSKPKKSYAYKPQYGLVILCKNEDEQIELFNKLKAQGLQLKVVTV